MRSASRGRTTKDNNRTKSPEISTTIAPYESILPPAPMSFQARAEMARSPVARSDMAKSPVLRQGNGEESGLAAGRRQSTSSRNPAE